MPQPSFKIFVPFTGAHIEKGTNKMIVEGLASTTETDLTGERMAESAIKAMAASNLPLSIRSERRSDWDSQLGQVVSLKATADHQLLMKAELDPDHPNAHFLFGKLQKGSQLGLSIGGQVNDWAWENDPTIGKAIRTYKDISLHEVSVTSHPAVASTFLSAINKSLNMKEQPMDKPTTVEKAEAVVPAPNEGQPVELEPADSVIAEEVAEGQTGTPVANPIEQAPAVNDEGVHLNPDQPAPADQPAALPEIPHTPGDSATPEQVAAQEDKTPDTQVDTQVDAQDVAKEPEAPAEQPRTDDAGHQEASPTGDTQPDATTTTEKSVAKAVYLGEYAEAEATATLVSDLADRLSWNVWSTIADDTKDAAAQKATVAAMLDEFVTLVTKVSTVLIDADAASDAAEAAKSYKDTRVTLAKSLDATTSELATVKKALVDRSVTLSEKEAELATAKQEASTTKDELEAAKKSLSEAESKAQTEAARKSYQVASKFDKSMDFASKSNPAERDKSFASFITGGK